MAENSNQKSVKQLVLKPEGYYYLLRILDYQEKPIEEHYSFDEEYLEMESKRFKLDYSSRHGNYLFDKRWCIHYYLNNPEHLSELFNEIIGEIDNDIKHKTPLFKCENCGFTIDQKPPLKAKETIDSGVTIRWCVGECPNCKTENTSKCKICNKTLTNYYNEVCYKCYHKAMKKCNKCIYHTGCSDDELGETYDWCIIYHDDVRLRKAVGVKRSDDVIGKVKDCKFYTDRTKMICNYCEKERCGCEFYCKYEFNPSKRINRCFGYQKQKTSTRIKRKISLIRYIITHYREIRRSED